MHSLKIKTESYEIFQNMKSQGKRGKRTSYRIYLDGNEICCRELRLDMGVDRHPMVRMDIFLDDVDIEINDDAEVDIEEC